MANCLHNFSLKNLQQKNIKWRLRLSWDEVYLAETEIATYYYLNNGKLFINIDMWMRDLDIFLFLCGAGLDEDFIWIKIMCDPWSVN